MIHSTHAKVAALLRSARDPQERAQRALRLIAEASYCTEGFLYLRNPTGPMLVARVGDALACLDVDATVKLLLAQGTICAWSAPDTLWSSDESTCFTPMLLRHSSGRRVCVTGVAVMVMRLGASLNPPTRLLQALSRSLCAAGDVQRCECKRHRSAPTEGF